MFIEPCPAISGLEENHKIVGLSFFTVQTVHCEYEKKMNNKGETFEIGSTIESVPGSAGHVQMCKNGAMYPVSRSEFTFHQVWNKDLKYSLDQEKLYLR